MFVTLELLFGDSACLKTGLDNSSRTGGERQYNKPVADLQLRANQQVALMRY